MIFKRDWWPSKVIELHLYRLANVSENDCGVIQNSLNLQYPLTNLPEYRLSQKLLLVFHR
jgi:hypothetical protein